MRDVPRDEVITALDALSAAIERNRSEERLLVERLAELRKACQGGTSVTGALEDETTPGSLQLLGTVLARLMETSGSARRALARSMRSEGTSIPSIAKTFGVTHQRVSNILNRPAVPSPPTLHEAPHPTAAMEIDEEEGEEDQSRFG